MLGNRVQSLPLVLGSLIALAVGTAWGESQPMVPPERVAAGGADSLAAPFLGSWKSDVDPALAVTVKSLGPGIVWIDAPGRFAAIGFVVQPGLHCVTRFPTPGSAPGASERSGILRARVTGEGSVTADFVDDPDGKTHTETWKRVDRAALGGGVRDRPTFAAPPERLPPPAPAPANPENPKFGEYVYVEELPEAIERGAPDYPAAARSAGVDGTVLVQALVGRDGRVKDAMIIKSIPPLDEAARGCVLRWRFKPAMAKGQPVAVWVAIPVKFTLH